MKREFDVGDKVICTMSGVVGVVEKFYFKVLKTFLQVRFKKFHFRFF